MLISLLILTTIKLTRYHARTTQIIKWTFLSGSITLFVQLQTLRIQSHYRINFKALDSHLTDNLHILL